jgi:putative oxidoreductase
MEGISTFRKLMATDNDAAIAILRLVLGVVFFAHRPRTCSGGSVDMVSPARWASSPDMMHIPAPFAVLAIAAEFFGGLDLIFGLFTRVAAFIVFCNMAVAVAMNPSPIRPVYELDGDAEGRRFRVPPARAGDYLIRHNDDEK